MGRVLGGAGGAGGEIHISENWTEPAEAGGKYLVTGNSHLNRKLPKSIEMYRFISYFLHKMPIFLRSF